MKRLSVLAIVILCCSGCRLNPESQIRARNSVEMAEKINDKIPTGTTKQRTIEIMEAAGFHCWCTDGRIQCTRDKPDLCLFDIYWHVTFEMDSSNAHVIDSNTSTTFDGF